MVADIIGSSLILQQDRCPDFDLYGTFQSILLPVIERGGGVDIEFTGDDVTAIFWDCQSAVNTGFAIHKALNNWNSSLKGPALTVRVGIHAGKAGDDATQQNLPLVVASRLQSLGRSEVLCVTASVIDEIDPVSSVHVRYSGEYSLGLASITQVFYLFDEKPKFLVSQRLLFERLRTQYAETVKRTIAVPAFLIFLLVAATFFVRSAETRIKNIEIAEVKNFSAEMHEIEISSIRTLFRTSLAAVPGINVITDSATSKTDLKLVSSFQLVAGNVRITWGVLQQDDRIQTKGGDITGKVENLAKLQRQLVQNIISHLGES